MEKSNNMSWSPPANGFEVAFNVSSTVLTPEEITNMVRIEPTKVRYAKNETRKYNNWHLAAPQSIGTIQEQIDQVLSKVQPHASYFQSLQNCEVSLSVFVYPRQFESRHPDSHPSFDLNKEQIALLHEMNATFVVD